MTKDTLTICKDGEVTHSPHPQTTQLDEFSSHTGFKIYCKLFSLYRIVTTFTSSLVKEQQWHEITGVLLPSLPYSGTQFSYTSLMYCG